MKRITALTAFLMSLCALANSQTKTGLHLLKQHKINSDGGWDYISIDPVHQRIYVSHATQVNILNALTGDSAGFIPNTTGVHGIAFATPFDKGYISNGKLANCTVIDLNNHKVLKQIPVGQNPDAIFYDDFSKNIIVFNGHSANASIINPVNDKVIATIDLGGKPEAGVSDGKGTIFVNLENKNEIVAFDAKTFKIKHHYKLSKGEEPSGLAIDRMNSRLFTVCSNKIMVVLNAKTGKEVATLPIGDGSDGVAFDPVYQLAYSSNGDGTMTVVKEFSASRFEVLENIKTAPGARTLAIDPKSHHIFMPTADFSAATATGKRPQRVPQTFRVLEIGK
ncbi:hypothetical protein [Pedobacter sp.]|jgi:DNA-binding beta-propeller fold protein YncE|uniref:YncE family protein n=1 Tax=Pedobacter sp. TaxID=1411316 RepID=UPI002CA4594F|nr:hypothetical protein [Pedobacter sp.]HWW39444.1 hypothetical protein [Pedobacter sp.]